MYEQKSTKKYQDFLLFETNWLTFFCIQMTLMYISINSLVPYKSDQSRQKLVGTIFVVLLPIISSPSWPFWVYAHKHVRKVRGMLFRLRKYEGLFRAIPRFHLLIHLIYVTVFWMKETNLILISNIEHDKLTFSDGP